MQEVASNKRVLIVIPPLTNHFYHLYLWAIVKNLLNKEIEFKIIFNLGPRDMNGKFREVTSKTKKLEFEFRDFLKKAGVSDDSFLSSLDVDVDFPRDYTGILSCVTSGDLLSVNKTYPLLNLSIHSILVSYLSSADESVNISHLSELLKSLQDSFHYSNSLCNHLYSLHKFDEVIFLNGRDPGQAGVRYFAEENCLSWHALEHGIFPGESFHLESFQTQDRIAIQERMLVASKDLSLSQITEIKNWYVDWREKQRTDKKYNPNVRSGNLPSYLSKGKGNLVPIFTTSLDEDVSSVGYSRVDLSDLISETIECARTLELGNYFPVIVIHPNSLNKSWNDLRLLYSRFKNCGFSVVWPWDDISSYEIMSNAKLVVTWRSTMALESVLEGVPAMNLAESTYDILVDIPRFQLSNLNEYDVTVRQDKAIIYLFFWMNHGHNLLDFITNSELVKLKKTLFRNLEANKSLAAFRYYFSVLSVPLRWGRGTPKQLHRFLEIQKSYRFTSWVFRIVLTYGSSK